MMLLKLGGSAITDKKKLRTFREDVTKRLLEEIKESGKQTILVHGAGSFGHILASEFELQKGFLGEHQTEGVSRVQADVRELNLRFLRIGDSVGLRPVSIPPSAAVLCEDRKIIKFNTELFRNSLELSLTPVTFGDVVFDTKLRFCICSGDDLMYQLSKSFKPEMAIFVTDKDGLFDKNPELHSDAKVLEFIDEDTLTTLKKHNSTCDKCSQSRTRDATGGIIRKAELMLGISKLGVDSIIINGLQPRRIKECLKGKKVIGTRAKGAVG